MNALRRHEPIRELTREPSRRLAVALLVTTALVVSVAASAVAATPAKVVGNVKNGRKLFRAHSCGSCHLMAAANELEGNGEGADLDTTRKTYAQIVTQITKGGHGMTGYHGVLTTVQIQDLAAFVYTTSHHR
ncbi:MAG TPA: cytochrome c [Gaiellaceae bacterium]